MYFIDITVTMDIELANTIEVTTETGESLNQGFRVQSVVPADLGCDAHSQLNKGNMNEMTGVGSYFVGDDQIELESELSTSSPAIYESTRYLELPRHIIVPGLGSGNIFGEDSSKCKEISPGCEDTPNTNSPTTNNSVKLHSGIEFQHLLAYESQVTFLVRNNGKENVKVKTSVEVCILLHL